MSDGSLKNPCDHCGKREQTTKCPIENCQVCEFCWSNVEGNFSSCPKYRKIRDNHRTRLVGDEDEPDDNMPLAAIVGCYTLDLYCTSNRHHSYGRGFGQFTGRTETACIRDARLAGWTVVKGRDIVSDRAKCPECKGTK